MKIANNCLFAKFEALCAELIPIPNDDGIWLQEKDTINEAVFRILDFSKYILRHIKMYYDNNEKMLRERALEAANIDGDLLAVLRAEGKRDERLAIELSEKQ